MSKSNFYSPPDTLKIRDNIAIGELSRIHQENPYYGVKRLAMALNWSENKARRIRDLAGIKVQLVHKKHHYNRVKAEIKAPQNLLRLFAKPRNPARPQDGMDYTAMTNPKARVWVQDFTYVKTKIGMKYVAVILSLATREILGWSIGNNHTADLPRMALLDALSRNPAPQVLHSDQGSEYLSFAMEDVCKTFNIAMSASSPHSPWQNGFCEHIMSTLKNEGESLYSVRSFGELAEIIAQRIYYYNNRRIHSKLRMPPAVYAKKLAEIGIDKVSGKMRA